MRLMASSILGAAAIAAGAFGAHALRERLTPDLLAIWQTAAHYHLAHAIVLLALALFEVAVETRSAQGDPSLKAESSAGQPPNDQATSRQPKRLDLAVPWTLLGAGVVLFSGSLYALALTGYRPLGVVTPFGGLLLIAGWVAIGLSLRSQLGRGRVPV